MRGLAGSRAAKVRQLFGLCKDFEEKVRKWRSFLTDVGCFEMQNAASANQSVKVSNSFHNHEIVVIFANLCMIYEEFTILSNSVQILL